MALPPSSPLNCDSARECPKVHSEIHSYAALGFAACGEPGRKAVLLCTFLDLFGGCAVCLIMACKQLEVSCISTCCLMLS